MNPYILAIITLIVGAVVGYVLKYLLLKSRDQKALLESEKILKSAELEANKMLMDAKEKALKAQSKLQEEERVKREELSKTENRLLKKEEDLEKKIESVEKKREDLEAKVEEAKLIKLKAEESLKQQESELEKVAALSKAEAKDLLFKKVEKEYQDEFVDHVKGIEKKAKEEAEGKARMILAIAMQKYAAETASESTATLVQLPNDEMKGRIIGREGRNINALEKATGVDVIVDETPETVILSGFDLLRRYIAKVALERLLADGRIHPARIEEVVEKVKEEVADLIKELGEKAAYESGVVGLPSEIVKLLGRLKFRTGNGQNVLKHSMEVSALAGQLASELGADVSLCKKAALLHDLGKAVDHEVSGHHAQIGADICRKFGMPENVCSIVESTCGEPEPETLEGIVVQVANMISENRAGIDQNNLESYIKRMEDLENIAKSFDGVEKAFAVHTGSEVRVLVNSDDIDDLAAIKLSHSIAKKIEADMGFAGQVKVNVVRETRAEAIAE